MSQPRKTVKQIADELRDPMLATNEYQANNAFGVNHPNALADGDDKGKGENNGLIGSLTDRAERARQTAINKFNSANTYKATD
jgi:hypothetical protein